jgi:hypothetical protein
MSVRNQCVEEQALVEFLYDGSSADEATAIAAHVATCVTCAEEIRALQATRDELQAWMPPDVGLGFRIAPVPPRAEAVPLTPRWWQQPLPAWAQVAAAVLLFSAGVTLGALRGASEFPVTIPAQSTSAGVQAPAASPVSANDLAMLERRLRADLGSRPIAPANAARPDDEALMQQVRALIRESERRQQQELTLRTAELIKDVDAQRRGDLARIERTFGQMEGTTGVQVEQQRQLLNYLMRVSQRQPQ